MFNPEITPSGESVMAQERVAVLLGLSESASKEEIVFAYDQMIESDKRTSEWDAERNTIEEIKLPIEVDILVASFRASQVETPKESKEKSPSMSAIAEALQNLGFNVTENDETIMREVVRELTDKKDDGIHSLPPGTEKALGL